LLTALKARFRRDCYTTLVRFYLDPLRKRTLSGAYEKCNHPLRSSTHPAKTILGKNAVDGW